MAERKSADAGINWAVVAFGGTLLALAVVAIPDVPLRVLASVAIFVGVIYFSQTSEEPEVENPLLEQMRAKSGGLDRRKYGRLRASTERLLEQVRNMNRTAIDGREGKVSPRHAHAELDRMAAQMRDLIDDVRKAAGVPTPIEEPGTSGMVTQPKVVMPKGPNNPGEGGAAVTGDVESEEDDETNQMLDELEAQALAEQQNRDRAEDSEGEKDDTDDVDTSDDEEEDGDEIKATAEEEEEEEEEAEKEEEEPEEDEEEIEEEEEEEKEEEEPEEEEEEEEEPEEEEPKKKKKKKKKRKKRK